MDNLLNHCLKELGFDGDLGCSPFRLGEFVQDFHSHQASTRAQTLDDNFMSFVWSLVVAHPDVRIGTVPPGLTSEVYVAPQTSAPRKAKAKGVEFVETLAPELGVIEDAKSRTLPDLIEQYGDALRIALTPDAVFTAITGSHIRSSKLSPMVYSSLQIITRGREKGVTVVELGQRTKYDQKTCFYLVKQLVDLNLIVKVRRGGVGTHFCLHRYFFDRDPSWKDIREEESSAELNAMKQEEGGEGGGSVDDHSGPAIPEFTPIDARHLSSLPLVRARVIKLLKSSRNHMHQSANMLLALGFSNPNKTDRRFFQTRMRDLMNQGVVEKVVVRNQRRTGGLSTTKCYRLVMEDASSKIDDGSMVIQSGLAEDDKEEDSPSVKCNITIHKQIHDLLEEAGQDGLTMTDLAESLSNFDKRTIELLLARADKNPPPGHLADLGIVSLMETYGRERRHRFMTAASYHELVNKEAALDATTSSYSGAVNLEGVGGFNQLNSSSFHQTEAELRRVQDSLGGDVTSSGKQKGRKKSAIKRRNTDMDEVASEDDGPASKKRRPASTATEDQDQPDKTPSHPKKRGRPRKHPLPEPSASAEATPTPKRRGRPPKNKKTGIASDRKQNEPEAALEGEPSVIDVEGEKGVSKPQARSKRRPSVDDAAPDDGILQKRPKISMNESVASMEVDQPTMNKITPSPNPAPPLLSMSSPTTPTAEIGGAVTEVASEAPLVPVTPFNDVERASMSKNSSIDGDAPAPVSYPSTPVLQGGIPIDPALLGDQMASPIPSRTETRPSQVASGKPAISHGGRLDVSRMRREAEIYRVIEGFNGITNINTKEFYDAHVALVEQLSRSGEPKSTAPGTKLDKRTVHTALSNLEAAGRIKMIRTSLTTHTGTTRPACIVYLATIDDSRVREYMSNLDKIIPTYVPEALRVIEQPVNYGTPAHKAKPFALLKDGQPSEENGAKKISRAQQLLQYEDKVVRDMLLTERTTVGQLYGFLTGKGLRCKLLHKIAVEAFLPGNPSPFIASREQRIINTSYFFSDIPIKTYCALSSALSHNDQLDAIFDSEDGRNTLVKNVPQSINVELQIGRARSRTRLLDLLALLHSLGIATPLQPSEPGSQVQCTDNGDHPSFYTPVSLESWSSNAPLAAPSYWQFHTVAPLFILSPSHPNPPFWKRMPIESLTELEKFWFELESIAKQVSHPEPTPSAADSPTCNISTKVLKTLCRPAAWSTEYVMTWHQQEYLKQFAMSTPHSEVDPGGWDREVARLSWTSSAPPDVVANFLAVTRGKLEVAAARHKRKKGRTDEQARAMLAHKAAEAREHREREWEELVKEFHLNELEGVTAACVARVKSRFLASVSTRKGKAQWEDEIRRALEEASKAEKNVLRRRSKTKARVPGNVVRTIAAPPVPVVVNAREKSVQSLIKQQEKLIEAMPTPPEPKKRKSRQKKKDEEEVGAEEERKPRGRRARFQWNWDFEELARDASVIIRARCRKSQKLDYSALDQVFPSLPRNTVRQRLVHIRQAPGNEAYLTRLEERWYQIWLQYRGTPHLPDEDINSSSNFDLATHIEFLRKHIDKNALRVGFLERQREDAVSISATVDDLLNAFSVVDAASATSQYDFMWNATKEEGREQALLSHAFTLQVDEQTFTTEDHVLEDVGVAESAVKMVMGTRSDSYDPETASALLNEVGDDAVAKAAKSLLSKGVLSKIVRDPTKPKPGRTLRISDLNQNALGGPLPVEMFQDASNLEGSSAQVQNTWREWPLLSSEGDTAALTHLASEGKIRFQIGITHARKRRETIDWNSKKADDDDIETAIQVMFHDLTLVEQPKAEAMVTTPEGQHIFNPGPAERTHEHGRTADGLPACCAQTADDTIDCSACLQISAHNHFLSLSEDESKVIRQILDVIQASGSSGVTKAQLLDVIPISYERINLILSQLVSLEVPLLFFGGYQTVTIVSSAYVSKWSIVVSKQPLVYAFPRRWLDIRGGLVREVWESALRAVVGAVVFRPGITQNELRWKLQSVYDRYEINEVLRHLVGNKVLRRETVLPVDISLVPDNIEEKDIMWFVSEERHWYNL